MLGCWDYSPPKRKGKRLGVISSERQGGKQDLPESVALVCDSSFTLLSLKFRKKIPRMS